MYRVLHKIINEFVSQFGEYTAEMGEMFEVDLSTNTIYYSLYGNVEFEDSFADFILSLDKDVPPLDIFLWSLLHEVGHLETEELDFPFYGKDELEEKYKDRNSFEDKVAYAHEYYRLPIEVAATWWAIEWAKDNRVQSMLQNKLLKEIIIILIDSLDTDE